MKDADQPRCSLISLCCPLEEALYIDSEKQSDSVDLQVDLSIAPGQRGYSNNIFSCFSTKPYVEGTHQKSLNEMLLMSTHKIIMLTLRNKNWSYVSVFPGCMCHFPM